MPLNDATWDKLSVVGEAGLLVQADKLYKHIKAVPELRGLWIDMLPSTETLFDLHDEDVDGAAALLRAVFEFLGPAFVTKLFVVPGEDGEEGQRLSLNQAVCAFANKRPGALTTSQRAAHVHYGVENGLPFPGSMPWSSFGRFKGCDLSFLSMVLETIAGAL